MRTHLALAAVLALLGPGAALAQNPGDEQYDDPLAPNEQPGGGGGGDASPGSDSGAPSGEEAPAGGSGARGDGSGELPRTGLPAGVMALLGAGMLGSGAALRRRLS